MRAQWTVVDREQITQYVRSTGASEPARIVGYVNTTLAFAPGAALCGFVVFFLPANPARAGPSPVLWHRGWVTRLARTCATPVLSTCQTGATWLAVRPTHRTVRDLPVRVVPGRVDQLTSGEVTGWALDANRRGQVVGRLDGPPYTIVWDDGEPLPPPSGAGYDLLNDRGQVPGGVANETGQAEAATWRADIDWGQIVATSMATGRTKPCSGRPRRDSDRIRVERQGGTPAHRPPTARASACSQPAVPPGQVKGPRAINPSFVG
jgi:hypothetical protein